MIKIYNIVVLMNVFIFKKFHNDSLIYFRFCKHKFHKECLDEINEIYNLNINKYNFCPICENIIS